MARPRSLRAIILRRIAVASLGALGVLSALVAAGRLDIPYRYDPFTPLDISAAPDWLTGYRLSRLSRSEPLCRAVLRRQGLEAMPSPRRSDRAECALDEAIVLPADVARLSSSAVATCALAARWLMFERHALRPAAKRHLGSAVSRSIHLGTHSCRRIAGSSRWSEHARANAIDIAEFVLADGSRVSVLRDWAAGGPRGAFLREARNGACRFFGAVLGPDYNAAHADHLHLDDGRFTICR